MAIDNSFLWLAGVAVGWLFLTLAARRYAAARARVLSEVAQRARPK